jgi:hypothetical protein
MPVSFLLDFDSVICGRCIGGGWQVPAGDGNPRSGRLSCLKSDSRHVNFGTLKERATAQYI